MLLLCAFKPNILQHNIYTLYKLKLEMDICLLINVWCIVCTNVCELFQTVVLNYCALSRIESLPVCSSSKSRTFGFFPSKQ